MPDPHRYPAPGYAPAPGPPQHPHYGQRSSGDPGPRPAAVSIAAVTSAIMTLPFIAGAVTGIVAIVNGVTSGESDAAASGVIFGGLAVVIAGGLGFLYGLGALGILQRGNPIPSTMVTVFTIVIVLGAARRAFSFGSGADLVVLAVWLVAVAGAITILVTLNLRTAKTWMEAKNRQFIASRRAARG